MVGEKTLPALGGKQTSGLLVRQNSKKGTDMRPSFSSPNLLGGSSSVQKGVQNSVQNSLHSSGATSPSTNSLPSFVTSFKRGSIFSKVSAGIRQVIPYPLSSSPFSPLSFSLILSFLLMISTSAESLSVFPQTCHCDEAKR